VSTLALMPSPLLGAAVWEPAAAVLRAAGHDALVVASSGQTPQDVLAGFRGGLPDGPLVLVPHSNAGLYVPGLAADADVAAVVFVDAALPPLDGAPAPTAPEALVAHLAGLAGDDGLLPPWSQWWDTGDIDGLFPDDVTRRRVQAQERRLPLSYFTDAVPSEGWGRLRCAYLAFGDTYADEVALARTAGWPVEVLPGRHLELLHHPQAVAERVVALAQRASPSSRGEGAGDGGRGGA
jgi:hypothetical protein